MKNKNKNYSSFDIERRLKVSRQYLYKLRESIPLIEGIDFFYIQIGKKKNYLYTKSGYDRIKRNSQIKKT
jgi:hypothetical protein